MRVSPGVFPTRLNVASDRANGKPWMAWLGRLARDGVVRRAEHRANAIARSERGRDDY
jgi:hypothetical protein